MWTAQEGLWTRARQNQADFSVFLWVWGDTKWTVSYRGDSQKHLGIASLALWVTELRAAALCEVPNFQQCFLSVLAESLPALHTTCSPHPSGDSVCTRCVSHLGDVGLFLIPWLTCGHFYRAEHIFCDRRKTNSPTKQQQTQQWLNFGRNTCLG